MAPQGEPLELARLAFGSGDPVVVLHGLFGSSRNWQSLAKALASDCAVYAVDLRNHGASPWSEVMTYPAMAGDIVRLLDDEGLSAAAVVGHSMGGKAAMATALLYPERVSRLVVADIAPVPYSSGLEVYIEAMAAIDLAAARRRSDVEAALAPAVPERAIRAFLAQNAEPEGSGMRWKLNLGVLQSEMRTISDWPAPLDGGRFDGPVLFLAGGRSDYVRPEHRQAMARQFPAHRLQTIDGAGHWLHAEAPGDTLEALRAFLD